MLLPSKLGQFYRSVHAAWIAIKIKRLADNFDWDRRPAEVGSRCLKRTMGLLQNTDGGMAAESPTTTSWFAQIWAILFPGKAELDPDFRAEIQRLSIRALYIIAGVNIVTPLTAFVFHGIAEIIDPLDMGGGWAVLLLFSLSGLLIGIARTPFGRRNARAIALVSGILTAIILIGVEMAENPDRATVVMSAMINVTVVLLVAVSAVPALPWQVFVLGASANGVHWLMARYVVSQDLANPVSLHYYAGMDLIVFLCVALSALNYRRIARNYRFLA